HWRRCFSKTARLHRFSSPNTRAHRRQLHAVGRDDGTVSDPIARWRFTHDLGEGAAERPEAGEAHVEADVGHAPLSLAEEKHGALNAPALQVPMWRLAEYRAEAADEVRGRDMGHGGHRADVERLGIGTVHGVAGAQKAAVQILGFTAHHGNPTS